MVEMNRTEKYADVRRKIALQNYKHTKKLQRKKYKQSRIYISICISFLCCLISLASTIGSSFAWFTSSSSNTGNRIKAGTLDVDLLMYKQDEGALTYSYQDISNGNGDIFSEANVAQNSNITLWEPGKTQVVYLAVKNDGDLALSYNIIINITDGGLASALKYSIINGSYDDIELDSIDPVTPLELGDNGQLLAAPNGKLLAGEIDYFAFALHMDENADASYMGKEIIFDVNVVATQCSEEIDSLESNEYDSSAVLPEADNIKHITDTETLKYVITIGGEGKLDNDMELEESVVVDNDFLIDLNGYNLTFSDVDYAFDVNNSHVVNIINTSDTPANIIISGDTELENNEDNLVIKEGKYAFDPSDYVDDGYDVTYEDNIWTVSISE